MSDKHIEKLFLYLVALSVLLHGAVFAIFLFLPQEKKTPKQEPYMVELRDLPEVKAPAPEEKKEVKRLAEKKQRTAREVAPKGERETERLAPPPLAAPPRAPQPAISQEPRRPQQQAERGTVPQKEPAPAESLFKPKQPQQPSLAKLFPSAGKMARIEESYRKKYGSEVEDGETAFLNTDDILFGSFLRRFETAVYGVWRYPQEAARQGLQGVTPVRITFNRNGEIENVEVLESSGSRILDEEVLRTLREIGRVGSFPRSYKKDKFKLIAFFQYGIARGGYSSTLH